MIAPIGLDQLPLYLSKLVFGTISLRIRQH